MKNIEKIPNPTNTCYMCELPGYFVEPVEIKIDIHTSYSITCPFCKSLDYLNTDYEASQYVGDHYGDNRSLYYFCKHCLIIYDIGCVHYNKTNEDIVYNGHIISKWKDLKSLIVYDGFPQFDSIEDFVEHANDIIIIDWLCPVTNTIKSCSHNKDKPTCFLDVKHKYGHGCLRNRLLCVGEPAIKMP